MIGDKIYKYNDDGKLETYRIVSKDKDFHIKNLKDGSMKSISNEEYLDKYVKLTPDAHMDIMITDKDNKTYGGDVFIVVRKDDETPAMVIRQNVYSITKNAFSYNGRSVGECITIKNAQRQSQIADFMLFDKVDTFETIGIYINDNIDTILEYVPQDITNDAAETLANIQEVNKSKKLEGFTGSLKELMEDNDFMYHFRDIFDIIQIKDKPITVSIGDNRPKLTILIQKTIEDILCKYIRIEEIIAYDKDIDLKKITSEYKLVGTDNGDIYLVTYEVIADYPVDEDIAMAFGFV